MDHVDLLSRIEKLEYFLQTSSQGIDVKERVQNIKTILRPTLAKKLKRRDSTASLNKFTSFQFWNPVLRPLPEIEFESLFHEFEKNDNATDLDEKVELFETLVKSLKATENINSKYLSIDSIEHSLYVKSSLNEAHVITNHPVDSLELENKSIDANQVSYGTLYQPYDRAIQPQLVTNLYHPANCDHARFPDQNKLDIQSDIIDKYTIRHENAALKQVNLVVPESVTSDWLNSTCTPPTNENIEISVYDSLQNQYHESLKAQQPHQSQCQTSNTLLLDVLNTDLFVLKASSKKSNTYSSIDEVIKYNSSNSSPTDGVLHFNIASESTNTSAATDTGISYNFETMNSSTKVPDNYYRSEIPIINASSNTAATFATNIEFNTIHLPIISETIAHDSSLILDSFERQNQDKTTNEYKVISPTYPDMDSLSIMMTPISDRLPTLKPDNILIGDSQITIDNQLTALIAENNYPDNALNAKLQELMHQEVITVSNTPESKRINQVFRYINLLRSIATSIYAIYQSVENLRDPIYVSAGATPLVIATLFFIGVDILISFIQAFPNLWVFWDVKVDPFTKWWSIWSLIADHELLTDIFPLIVNVFLNVYGYRFAEVLENPQVLNTISMFSVIKRMMKATVTVNDLASSLINLSDIKYHRFVLLMLFVITLIYTLLFHGIRVAKMLHKRAAYTLSAIVIFKALLLSFDLLTGGLFLYEVLVFKGPDVFGVDRIVQSTLSVVIPSFIITLCTNALVNVPLHYTYLRMRTSANPSDKKQHHVLKKWNLIKYACSKAFHPIIMLIFGSFAVYSLVMQWIILKEIKNVQTFKITGTTNDVFINMIAVNTFFNYGICVACAALYWVYIIVETVISRLL